jgi:hypothetical protein
MHPVPNRSAIVMVFVNILSFFLEYEEGDCNNSRVNEKFIFYAKLFRLVVFLTKK